MRRLSLLFSALIFASVIMAQSAPASFRFAFLTDTHLSPSKPQAAQDLKNVVNDINNQKGIAFAIVGGDISDHGDAESLKAAKAILDELKVPYYVIPGNHDTRFSDSGMTAFKAVFGDDKFRLLFNGYAFIGLNTGPMFNYGDGHVSPSDMVWFQRQLKNIGKKSPVFVVTHHPLKTGDVDNWFSVTDNARKYNTQGVLSGHYHRNTVLDYDGIPGIVNRTTQRGSDPTGGYSIYDMADSLYVYEKRIGMNPERWFAMAINDKMYTEGNSKLFPRPDYAVNKENNSIKSVWSKSFENAIYTAPAVANNHLYFGDDKGVFRALSLDKGKEVWKFQTGNRILSTPAVSGNFVVFASTDHSLYCLDATKGQSVWQWQSADVIQSSPVIVNEVVYLATGDGKLLAFDLNTGSLRWTSTELKGVVTTAPTVADGFIYVGSWDGTVYAFDTANGTLKWKNATVGTKQTSSPAVGSPVVSGTTVFVASTDHSITALSSANGDILWKTSARDFGPILGISSDNKTIFNRCGTDSVVAINTAATAASDYRWGINAAFGKERYASTPVEAKGTLFVTTKNGLIIALNSETGALRWQYKVGNCVVNPIVPLADGGFVVTTVDGAVMRFSIK